MVIKFTRFLTKCTQWNVLILKHYREKYEGERGYNRDSVRWTAWRTQLSQLQRGCLVSAPLISLQMREPTLVLKALESSLVMAVVGFSELLSRPATIAAPQRAPQVAFIEPIPAPNPEPRLSSCSFVICWAFSNSGANSKRTAWQQFKPKLCFTSTECSALFMVCCLRVCWGGFFEDKVLIVGEKDGGHWKGNDHTQDAKQGAPD